MNKRHSLFVFMVFIASTCLFAQGIDHTWVGDGAAGVWEDADNWNPAGVPTVGDDLLIDGAYSVTVSSTSTIKSLQLAGGADLTIADSYTLTIVSANDHDGIDIRTGASLTINGTLISNGHLKSGIDVNANCSLAINVSGVVSINNVVAIGIQLEDNMVNDGTVTISVPTGKAGIRMENNIPNRTVVNNGSITISGGTEYGIDQSQQTWLFTNNGTVTLSSAGVALVREGTDFINNGTFKGNGLIQNNDFSTPSGSTLAPGTSVGKLTFADNVDFTDNVINIEIDGNGVPGTDYDQIVVNSGTVNITGATLNLSGSYMPMVGEQFSILEKISAGAIEGTFSGLPNNFTINYSGGDGNDVVLTAIEAPLPVELIDFSAHPLEDEVKLSWATATETNNDYYTLERSPDGRTFEAIAMINGSGNTTEISNYTHMDENPERGLNYYRLKQTDFDGQFSYSDIKTAELKTDEAIKVYPTVVSKVLTVETGDEFDGDVTIVIRDQTGRDIKSFPIPSKSNKTELSIDDLIPGNYYVVIYNNEKSHTQKIIKL